MISIYVVAESRLLREALVRLFQNCAGLRVVGESSCSESIHEQIAMSRCHVLLLDPSTMPTMALISELYEKTPEIEIVLFGMDENSESFLRAVRNGVRGYVLKEASSAEIIAAVRGVAQGGAICPPTLCRLLFQFASREFLQRPTVTNQQGSIKLELTYRQRQLVSLVAKGMTNKEIASSLNLSEFTVKNHLHRIMKQIQAESRMEAVDVARACGVLPAA